MFILDLIVKPVTQVLCKLLYNGNILEWGYSSGTEHVPSQPSVALNFISCVSPSLLVLWRPSTTLYVLAPEDVIITSSDTLNRRIADAVTSNYS
jgi:hypothetical protein